MKKYKTSGYVPTATLLAIGVAAANMAFADDKRSGFVAATIPAKCDSLIP